jgi:hypothetical protein
MQLEKAARLVEQFEKGILPKEQWTHTAHCALPGRDRCQGFDG